MYNLRRKVVALASAVAVVGTMLSVNPLFSMFSSAENTSGVVAGDVYPFGEYGYDIQQNITSTLANAQASSHGWQGQYYNGTAWVSLEKMINDGSNKQVMSAAAATAGTVTGNAVGESGGFYAPGFRSTTGCQPKLAATKTTPVAMTFTAPQDGTYVIPAKDSAGADLDAGKTVTVDSATYGAGNAFGIAFANNTDANKKATVKVLFNDTVVDTYSITGAKSIAYGDLNTKAFTMKQGDVLRFAVYNDDASTTFTDNANAQVQITSELKYYPTAVEANAAVNRTPVVSFDFNNVTGSTVTDKVSGVTATYGREYLNSGKATQDVTDIPTDSTCTLDGSAAFAPNRNRDLMMPYQPLSETGHEATIQAWVKMSEINDWNELFWAGPTRWGATETTNDGSIQQNNFMGIEPQRGDTHAMSYVNADKTDGGNNGAVKVAATSGTVPKVGVWTLITVTQNGTDACVYMNDQKVAEGNAHYLMSELLSEAQVSDSTLTMDDLKMSIGSFVDGWDDQTVHGLVDDFKIYNVALTGDEVGAQYAAAGTELAAQPYYAVNVQYVNDTGRGEMNFDGTKTIICGQNQNNQPTWNLHPNQTVTLPTDKQVYFKTFVKVTPMPGNEQSATAAGDFDGGGATAWWPSISSFTPGQWKSIVVPATLTSNGVNDEFRVSAVDNSECYNVSYGSQYVIDSNDTPLPLPANLSAENTESAGASSTFPNYIPANASQGVSYNLDGNDSDGQFSFCQNTNGQVTVTSNGNYFTTTRDVGGNILWNGYPDRFGVAAGLPAGKYDVVFAYKTSGTPNPSSTGAIGSWDIRDHGSQTFGSTATADGKWHIEVDTYDATASGIAHDWEFRVQSNWAGGDYSLSIGHVYIVPHVDAPSITLDNTSYTSGDPITVNFSNLNNTTLFGQAVDGMKIVNADGSDIAGHDYWIDYPDSGRGITTSTTSYTYTFTADGQNNNFVNLPAGSYKMKLQAKDGTEITSVPFTVVAAPSITLDKTTYTAGDPITVSFHNLDHTMGGKAVSGMKIVNSDNSDIAGHDYWIDFPDSGRNITDPNGSFTYQFTADGQNGNFVTLPAGSYKMRLQLSGGTEIVSVPFTVTTAPVPTISLDKASYTAGNPIVVTYNNLDATVDGKAVSGMKIVMSDNTDVPGGNSYWIDYPDTGRGVTTPSGTYTYTFTAAGQNNSFVTLPAGSYKMRLQLSGGVEAMSVPFTVTAAASNACDITAFKVGNATGTISGTNIAVTVPYGTDVTNLTPTVTASANATYTPSGAQNFTNPVNYVVTAQDGITQKTYKVTVTVAPSTACDITSFKIGTAVGAISGTNISVSVPNGTDVTKLTPVVVTSAGATYTPSGVADFTNPVNYVVTAQDGTTKQTYKVTVTVAPSTACDITSFKIGSTSGTIDANNNISVTVPYGTDVKSLTPTVAVSGGATYTPSGAADFTSPVNYVVTAADKTTTKTYKVTVKVAQNTDTKITAVTIGGVAGTISGSNISVTVPAGTDVTHMTPTFTLPAGATVTPSGAVDFTHPVTFTVTAADGTTKQTFTVTVTVAAPSSSSSTPSSSSSSSSENNSSSENSSSSASQTGGTSSTSTGSSSANTSSSAAEPSPYTGGALPVGAALLLLAASTGLIVYKIRK